LRKALPVVMQRGQECVWNPRVLPFEVVLPIVQSFPVREESEVVVGVNLPAPSPAPLVFHKQLRCERELHGWTQADLAEKLEASPLMVAFWERGERLPSLFFQERLFEVLGKGPEELGLVDQQNRNPPSGLNNITPDLFAESGLQLDPSRRRVWIDGSLLSTSLTRSPFRLLQFLAEHAGEVCPREETSKAVYGERYVAYRGDSRLDALIGRTRQQIGEDPRSPRFIETVPGVGHRLNEYIGERS
jgi:DNA-binding winged helix-turn-helix (wHTH) protein/DNA-binding XRE family transcriptional regulator